MAYIYFGVVHNIRPGKQAMKNINSLDIPIIQPSDPKYSWGH